ncbi:Serine protease 40 [Lemmus lemmus]
MTSSERWPWQASLLFRGRHICGAVLIDKNWVASAAHCFQSRSQKPSEYRILLGYNQLGSPTEYSRQMTVNMLILHENYNKFYHQGNDIALIQLHKPVTYSSSIFPACVPENTTKVSGDRSCWISGWGMLREDGEYTGRVKRVRGKRLWRPFLWFLNQNVGFWLKSKLLTFRTEVWTL